RDRRGCSFSRLGSKDASGCGNDGHATTREVGHQSRQAIELALQPMVLHRHVLAFDVAGFVEALAEPGNKGRIRQSGTDEADHRHRARRRPGRERPRRRCDAEPRDEFATPHSISSSARPANGSGTVSPRALAILRLMTRVYLSARWIGKSPGLAPLRMRSM